MSMTVRIALFSIPLLLIILTVVAVYAYSQIIALHLPIPRALGLLTIFLPLITGFSTRFTQNLLIRSSKKEQNQLTVPILFVLGFQLIYEIVIITLSFTNIIPPNSLNCALKDKWQQMRSARDETAIRAIQDRFNCCGFFSTKDQAWPFPDKKHTVSACQEAYGRTKSCFGDWRQAQQVNAGLFLLVAIVVFMVNVTAILFLTTGSSWSQNVKWVRGFGNRNGENAPDVDDRRTTRRLIDGGEGGSSTEVQPFRDDLEDFGEFEAADERGPRGQPSSLRIGDGENAWGVEPGNVAQTA